MIYIHSCFEAKDRSTFSVNKAFKNSSKNGRPGAEDRGRLEGSMGGKREICNTFNNLIFKNQMEVSGEQKSLSLPV